MEQQQQQQQGKIGTGAALLAGVVGGFILGSNDDDDGDRTTITTTRTYATTATQGTRTTIYTATSTSKVISQSYTDPEDSGEFGKWFGVAIAGIVGAVLLIIIVFSIINSIRNRRKERPITGTSWIPTYNVPSTDTTFKNCRDEEDFVPQYTERVNMNDLGYYDERGDFHRNEDVRTYDGNKNSQIPPPAFFPIADPAFPSSRSSLPFSNFARPSGSPPGVPKINLPEEELQEEEGEEKIQGYAETGSQVEHLSAVPSNSPKYEIGKVKTVTTSTLTTTSTNNGINDDGESFVDVKSSRSEV
ncbi:Rcr1p NDAI_0G01640 [Naumovozyma dairenensis CBS 421]|uniref:Uncharacterized protein n=1 Tax=Naumovozyma dairenensis (strain ATCC 10597 / BCRC 20456 / CBS 421 / NBRC 0211 / NRRL Y-12639) TaxID=1071378 RepID=G0WDS9_NAUDC|nr:hypothetical protein NDAI_0G01640 [Naumovozyma dairenensis CBS 421]CCD25940.2 hypothetical protein NDAI_0G01640 [Naumovozyma dairenensis CBS 421]